MANGFSRGAICRPCVGASRGDPQRAEQVEAWRSTIARAEEKLAATPGAPVAPSGEERLQLLERLPPSRNRLAELETMRIVRHDLLIERKLEFDRGGSGPVEILHMPGHTEGDLVVYLPQRRFLITGDLVDDLPYGGHDSPVRWLDLLRELEQLDFEWMIPGHGSVWLGKDHLTLIRRLVESILDQTQEAISAGKSLEETQQFVDLETFRQALAGEDPIAQRALNNFMPATMEQAWKELSSDRPGFRQ